MSDTPAMNDSIIAAATPQQKPLLFIVLNGPPYSGKSTASRELSRMLNEKARTISDSFAAPMKHFIATLLGEAYADMDKDKPRPELSGYSVRQFLIDLSQNYMKPRYGDDVYGRMLLHRALRYPGKKPRFVVCDDGGFAEELAALDNHLLVRVERPGHDFSSDSRTYLPDPHWVIVNDSTVDELWIQVRKLAHEILTTHL